LLDFIVNVFSEIRQHSSKAGLREAAPQRLIEEGHSTLHRPDYFVVARICPSSQSPSFSYTECTGANLQEAHDTGAANGSGCPRYI
jgi:hypothetical protein